MHGVQGSTGVTEDLEEKEPNLSWGHPGKTLEDRMLNCDIKVE